MTSRSPFNCPVWCTEPHDPHDPSDVAFGSVDHTASFLHVLGGAYVGLHRLDVGGVPGRIRVVCDPGEDGLAYLTPAQARRFAHYVALSGRAVDSGQEIFRCGPETPPAVGGTCLG